MRLEHRHAQFTPIAEVGAGCVLLAIAIVLYIQLRRGKTSTEPSARIQRWLQLNNLYLFVLGAALVTVQSVFDVVFIVAMIRLGQSSLSTANLLGAAATYATALALQLAVVISFWRAPAGWQKQVVLLVQKLVERYSYQASIIVSALLGLLLLLLAVA